MNPPPVERRGPTRLQQTAFALLLTAVAAAVALFSAFPWTASAPEAARLRVAVKHVAAREAAGRRLSAEELERLPRHMRPLGAVQPGTGRRLPSTLEVRLDGGVLLRRSYRPTGLRRDGPTFIDEELAVPPGRHRLEVRLVDGEASLDGLAGRAGPVRPEAARSAERGRAGPGPAGPGAETPGEPGRAPRDPPQRASGGAAGPPRGDAGRGESRRAEPPPESAPPGPAPGAPSGVAPDPAETRNRGTVGLGAGGPAGWHLAREVEIQPRQVLLVEFLDEGGLTVR